MKDIACKGNERQDARVSRGESDLESEDSTRVDAFRNEEDSAPGREIAGCETQVNAFGTSVL